MRRLPPVVLLMLLALAAGVSAAQAAPPPPGADISDSLAYVGRLPDSGMVTEGKFDRLRGREVLVINGRFGLKTYDVSDPGDPRPLDDFLPADLAEDGFWQGEDMDVDRRRKLVFLSLDPRHDDKDPIATGCPADGSTRLPQCRSGVYVVSYADPRNLRQVGPFTEIPAGHTSSCIDDCRFLWTGGPARRTDLAYLGPFTEGERGDGRPVWVTDMRNPSEPEVYGQPLDLLRNDGATDYSHDVQVDEDGVAWTSGRGGVRGYATSGRHRDPTTNTARNARPWDPILVSGGGFAGGPAGVSEPESMFMHNSARPTDGGVRAGGVADGNVLVATEEEFNDDCRTDGRLVFADLTSSWGGEGALNSTPAAPYRMAPLGSWHPSINTPETTAPNTDCSAHYFDIDGSVLAQAWYSQGVRVLDVSDARAPRQIGYFRVTAPDPPGSAGALANPSSVVWDTQFHRGLLWVFDMERGVEVLRLRAPRAAGAGAARVRLPSVIAPDLQADRSAPVAVADGQRTTSGLVCPLFEDSAATRAAAAGDA